LIEKLK